MGRMVCSHVGSGSLVFALLVSFSSLQALDLGQLVYWVRMDAKKVPWGKSIPQED